MLTSPASGGDEVMASQTCLGGQNLSRIGHGRLWETKLVGEESGRLLDLMAESEGTTRTCTYKAV
jgi:hypothetical protein